MSNRYEDASPEELGLYQYAARTRRQQVKALELGIGMTGNVVKLCSALRTLQDALTVDEVMLNNAVAKLEATSNE